jgi:DNA modification methylase
MTQIRDRIRELRRVPAGELQPNPKNYRRHGALQSAAMRGLLNEIGYAGALLARELPDGKLQLIDGHLRLETTPKAIVPVLVLDVTEDEADKILLTFDPISALAETDKAQMEALLATVRTEDTSIAAMLERVAGESAWQTVDKGEVQEDAVPAPPANPVARLGQIWQLGKHRLLCGDSTRSESVQRLMGEERAKLFQTDPPYAVDYSGGSHPATRANRGKANRNKNWSSSYHEADGAAFKNENGGGDNGREFYLSFCRVAIERAIAPDAAWYCWHASARQAMLEAVWNEVGAFMHQQILWVKSRPVLTYSVYMWQHEPCMFGWIKGNKPQVRRSVEGGYSSTVWEVPNSEAERKDHPTCKPNRLFAMPMLLHTMPGDLCYEPFSGSGSQLIAAEQLHRRCYAIELEPRFVDVAVARWEKLTGKKAKLIGAAPRPRGSG